MADRDEIVNLLKASPAERQVMLEQCETIKLQADRYITAVAEGRLKDLPDLFYEITSPYEYLGKVLAQRMQAAMHEAVQAETPEG
jgi:hypothetical protein